MNQKFSFRVFFAVSSLLTLLGSCGEEETENPNLMKVGDNYYLIITQIQVPPRPPRSSDWSFTSDWDDLGSGAPDIFYRMTYQGQIHYTSSVADDTIHASYSPIKGGFVKAILTKNASQYIEGAMVNCYNQDAHVDYQIIDEDSADDDTIGRIRIPFKVVKEGMNTFNSEGITITLVAINTKSDINQQLRTLGLIP
jgi:hypothetical protein